MNENCFDEAVRAMEKLYGGDCVMQLATLDEGRPNVRCINATYLDGAFYVVTHAASHKMRELAANPASALCKWLFAAQGRGYNAGHPREPRNEALRDKLRETFISFYDRHNNEDDPGMCFLRFEPDSAIVFADGFKYAVDFANRAADRVPCEVDIIE